MKYIDEFRGGELARKVAADIAREARPDRHYRLMEFRGGHTHAIFRYGIPDLLPRNVKMIHGPGCPVCVLPIGRLDLAIRIARQPGTILASNADMLRVPGSRKMSLMRAKAEGADVRMVYSATDALAIARENPDKQVVFFAIGFETTTPPTAVAVLQAQAEGLSNFSVYCNHVLTPPAPCICCRAAIRTTKRRSPSTVLWAGACQGGLQHRRLSDLCRALSQAGGHQRLRAARRAAVDPDAGAATE